MADSMRTTSSNHLLGGLLGLIAIVSATSLGIASVDPSGFFGGILAAPGRFLHAMLHLAAWWIPIYFAALTVFALRRAPVTWGTVVLLNMVHLPVLTGGALIRLVAPLADRTAPLLRALESQFGIRGSALLLSIALAAEAGLLLHVWRMFDATGQSGTAEDADVTGDTRAADTDAAEETESVADGTYNDRKAVRALPAPELYDPEKPVSETLALLRQRMEVWSEKLEHAPVRHDASEPKEAATTAAAETAATAVAAAAAAETTPTAATAAATPTGSTAPIEHQDNAWIDDDDEFDGPHHEAPLPLYFHRRDRSMAEDAELVASDEVIAEYRFDDEDLEDDPVDEYGLDVELELEADDEPVEAIDDELEDGLEEEHDDTPPIVPRKPKRKTRQAYKIPVEGILRSYSDGRYWEIDDTTRDAAEVLRVTLEEFGIRAEVTGIRKGPVITMFEILPAPGVKLTKITNLADNIALRLAASSVRIVAPIPGKHAVGIEIPNRERNLVSFAELLRDDEFFGDRFSIPIALGKDIAGEAAIVDLAKTPHMLIAGATGSGKSVCVNSIICSILYRRNPSEVKLILIDPKIVELKFYNDIPHLLTPVITDPKRAFQALQYLIYEMERRYSLLDSLGARDIAGYNAKIARKNLATEPLPFIVVIIDEFADLMATSGKELESTVARLTAMSRAVGIHLVLATQRPSTDVITGLIKANIPARIAFMVASKIDSRIIIDAMGAEKLLGRGDMLYTSASDPFPVRMQGAFLSEDEVDRVVSEVKQFGEPDYIDDEIFIEEDDDDLDSEVLEDPLMEKAIEVVTNSRKASASYLQRRLKVGYNRAARMVEEMERMGIVGPQNGSKPRDVISGGGM